MNRHVNSIAGRLSLRPPQLRSLEILDRVTELVAPRKASDHDGALTAIRAEYPTVTDFERAFPSLCFALATGVGKTRLMGAFISYLHQAHGLNNFFVLAPNLTIYNKLITDFTPNTPKYVFKGIAEFATDPPELITGDNYEWQGGTLFDAKIRCRVNVFNISKINSEVRGGRSPRIKRLSEYIGESYFEYLAALPDLVLIMDESHRYRASAGAKAINDLNPVLGLELTATPFVESNRGPLWFKNVIYDYPLGRALADGFVKEPAVVTRKDFNPAGMSPEAIERLKLEDGVRLHESVKVELETHARETGQPIVKPFVLVIARDTTHAAHLKGWIESDGFFEGRYRERVIQVDSSRSGEEEDRMVERLLKVERRDEPTEIVIHVNMLKEGWDVTNLYTIVPLRAANARTLIEQSIGRGLRLPYGKRTGVTAVDRLNIVAHDRFQEIIDDSRRADSPIQLQQVILAPEELEKKTVTVLSEPVIERMIGTGAPPQALPGRPAPPPPLFEAPPERLVAHACLEQIRKLESEPAKVPVTSALLTPDMQAELVRLVQTDSGPEQLEITGITFQVDFADVVERTTRAFVEKTIDIPRIVVVPRGHVRSGFHPFQLDLSSIRYPEVSEALWIHHLHTDLAEALHLNAAGWEEARLEDYVVSGLVDFDDVAYDDHADFLYELAGQVVRHLQDYLPSEEAVSRVLRYHQRDIARLVHAQMLEHYWVDAAGWDVSVTRGFTQLKESAFTAPADAPVRDFRLSPEDKSNMARYVFGGFERCLCDKQKFQSDTERKMAVILDRQSLKWFKPAKGQFKIYYRAGADPQEYVPDFVAESAEAVYMMETKARNEMESPDVLAKRDAAVEWCSRATEHAVAHGGKPWRYLLVPHDAIAENITLNGLQAQFA